MPSAAVHPVSLDDDDDDGAVDDAPSALSPHVQDVLASSSRVWTSVSDSDSEDDAPITYPQIHQPDAGSQDGVDDEGEVVESVEVEDVVSEESGGFGVAEGEEDVLEQEILVDLENSRADSVDVGSVLGGEEMLRSEESSSGSVVNNGNERDRDGEFATQELPDDWLEVEDASSSVVQETHDLQYTPVKTTNLGSKRVYTFPRSEDEVLPVVEEVGSQILSWPAGLAIEIIGFQVKLIVKMISLSLWLCSFSFAAFIFPFRASLKAANLALTTAVEGYTLATQIKPMVKEGVAQAGPMLRRATQKCGFGCLAAFYVIFMLGSLLIPALFLDLFLVRGFIDEPVEFREVLHFDYRQV